MRESSRESGGTDTSGSRVAGLASLRARYLAAQLAGDRGEAQRIVVDDGLGEGFTVDELQAAVIEQAQKEIGRLWEQDRISVAEEHLATAISQVVLSQLFVRGKLEPRNGRKVVVACVQGELHDFPARLVADALDRAGFEVRFLGSDVPTDSLCALVEKEKPALLALSVTMSFNLANVAAVTRAVRAGGQRLMIAVGGHALGETSLSADELGADFTAIDAATLVRAARSSFGLPVA